MLIRDGKKLAKIVIPQDGNSCEGYAEKQLKKYLDMITGECFVIEPEMEESQTFSIYVGECNKAKSVLGARLNDLQDDGYIIYCDGNNLYLTGKDTIYSSAGTIYAVFEWLEKFLGVRFYSYDEEFVPKKEKIEMPGCYILENPKIFLRQYLAASTRKHTDYCVKMRIKDCFCGDVPGGVLSPLWAGSQGHNYFEFCSPEKYQQEHPDWFDMENHQLCFSHPESAQVTIEGLKKKILENPNSKFFAFGQNDTPTPCQCDKCKQSYEKYGVSGTMVRYSNIIARAIKEWTKTACPNREIYIVIMAYLFSVAPPVKKVDEGFVPIAESVVPCDNVYVFYCNIDFCFYHSLLDQSCEWNKKFKDEFLGWKSLVGDKILIWNYAANYPHYLYPYFGYSVVAENYRFFIENNVSEHVIEHAACEAEFVDFSELKTYVYSKLLWNPYQDTEQLMNDFIDAYYKQCSSEIKEYFALLKKRFAEIDGERGYHLRCYFLPDETFAFENFPIEFIKELFGCFDRALEKCKDDETMKKRIIRGYISAKYLLLMNYDKYGLSNKEEFLQGFLDDCNFCGINKYKEDWRPNINVIPDLIEQARKGEVLKY